MNLIERLGNWYNVFDKDEFSYLLNQLRVLYKTESVMPASNVIFKAFEQCPFDKCKVIMLFQDPYPQKNVATGIALANSANTPISSLSPSLKKFMETVPEVDQNFDITLESWCNQGVLMLNSALTVVENKINSHALLWRLFISTFLMNYSDYNRDCVYVLFGKQAQNFKQYIKHSSIIMETWHPSYLVRNKEPMPDVLSMINNTLVSTNRTPINWNVRK